MKALARFISFFCNPFFVFLIMPFLVVYKQTESIEYALKWGVFSAVFVIAALCILLIGMTRRVFSDFDITHKEERKTFYLLILPLTFLYLFSALFLKGLYFPLSIIAFGLVLGGVLFTLANHFMKASVHMGVICSFSLTISILYKVFLKKHTMREAIAGGLLGSVVTIATFIIGVYLYKT